jgi:hypothetical protein
MGSDMRSLVTRDTLTTVLGGVAAGVLASLMVLGGVTIGFGLALAVPAILVGAALIVGWPLVGFYVVAGCAVLVEQSPLFTPVGTDRLTIYYWPPALEGFVERPIGILFIFILLMLVCHRLINRQQVLCGGALLWPFLFYLLCVAGGVLHGLTSGGDLKITVVETRPFWYLFMSYLIACNLVTHKRHLRAFFWIVIIGAGVKGLQGLYIVLIVLHGNLAGHREIMAHEESFFFVAFLILVALLWWQRRDRPQLYAALFVLPCVLVALVSNQRRAAYIAFLVGVAVAWILVARTRHEQRRGSAGGGSMVLDRELAPLGGSRARRRAVARLLGLLVCAGLGAGYVGTFEHSGGWFAEPARAIVSNFQPDPQDAASNQYRSIEDYDLQYTAKQNPWLGLGFGKPFLTPKRLPDISRLDPYYLYTPHNTVYWVWMRLGTVGFFALWYLLGTIILRGCLAARQLQDPYLQLAAMFVVVITVMEVISASADYQLFTFRNVIYLGLLAGLVTKLPDLDEQEDERGSAHASPHGLPVLAASVVGRGYPQLLSPPHVDPLIVPCIPRR